MVTFILSLCASGKSKGVDIKSGEFFRNARRSGLRPEAEAVHRCSLSRSRKKLLWTIFQDILEDAVELAYKLRPRDPSNLWHGMSVIGVDGSKYNLPATEDNRKEFDPQSGLDHEGKGQYPQCLVSTAYDVFRRIPVARTVLSIHVSEREEALNLLPSIRPGAVLVFDRGYPSYHVICSLRDNYNGYFIFRCPAKSTFPAVEEFVHIGRQEGYILFHPSNNYLEGLSRRQKKAKVIQLRIIRLVSPDGTVSVLLTNLLNQSLFPREDIVDLYFRRWEVETNYRNEKVVLEIEEFHGKSANSIRQELYAVTIMSVIARTLMVLTSRVHGSSTSQFQFKSAIMTLEGVKSWRSLKVNSIGIRACPGLDPGSGAGFREILCLDALRPLPVRTMSRLRGEKFFPLVSQHLPIPASLRGFFMFEAKPGAKEIEFGLDLL